VLEGAVASFDCRIVERLERGTHAVIFCEAQAVKVSEDAEALVYFGRGYRTLGQED
jgi:flavin reductase